MKLKIIFLLLVLLVSGCSALELLNEEKIQIVNETDYQQRQHYCQEKKIKSQLLNEDKDTLLFYQSLDKSILQNPKYSFVDKSIMITLIELIRRPDQIGPHSRFQVYLKVDNKNYYYDFHAKDIELAGTQPLIVALEYLSKKFIKRNSINTLISDLEVIIPKNILVSENLERFLRKNSKQLLKNDIFYQRFFKGDEVITKYETFKRQSFKKIMSISSTSKNLKNYNYESSDLLDKNVLYKCNFKINDEISYLKNDTNHEIKKSHPIGFIEGKNIFLAVSSFDIDTSYTNQFDKLYFFKGLEPKNPYPFCFIDKSAGQYALFSSKDRNPEQFMQHLLSYEIENSSDHQEVNQILNFSRHLVLSNPDRILYESKKGRKNQLNFFLTMNFPVYHAEALGNIFGYATIPKASNEPILHIDSRNQGELWCRQ